MRRRTLMQLFAGAGLAAMARKPRAAPLSPVATVYARADFGAVGDGIADDSGAIYAALAYVSQYAPRGPELVFEPGCYLVPSGIVESVPGLVMRGIGARVQGPGNQAALTGVTIKATNPGVWVWRRVPPTAAANEYRGGHFSGLTFQGNPGALGGLQIQTCYNVIERCGSCWNTTGVGFQVSVAPSPIDSAAENLIHACVSSDDFIGYELGNQHGSAETELSSCLNLKFSLGGIKQTGYGVRVWDNNSRIRGGKFENNDTGILVKSTPGINITDTRFEGNKNWDVDLYRDSGTNGTRNVVNVPTSKIRVGPFQVNDSIYGGGWDGQVTVLGTGTIVMTSGGVNNQGSGTIVVAHH